MKVATAPSAGPATPPPAGRTSGVHTALSRGAMAIEALRARRAGGQMAAGFASPEEAVEAIAQQFRLPRVELDGLELSLELAALIPKAFADKHRVVPVFTSGQELSVATYDPTQLEVFDWLGRELRRTINVMIASPAEIDRAYRRLYEPRTAPELDGSESLTQEALAEASQFVNGVLARALEAGASDIHVEASEAETIVRYRVDGMLRRAATCSADLHPAITSRLKVLANLDISTRHVPQDGRIKVATGQGDLDLRVSVLPTYWGEKVVCRILDNRKAALPLDALGFEPEQRTAFERMIRNPYGLILVTGPTGSGKSTTLYSALNAVRSPELNIVTVEDPIEYQLAGINQVGINVKRGLTFANALRSILRQDPDVILVGEVRDRETGVIAAEAALTGHLVMTSLHTNDAASAILRLTELGIEPHLVAPSLLGVVAQRLMRKVCTACAVPHVPDEVELEALGLPELPHGCEPARGRGCAACGRTGFSGRVAIRELLEVDDRLRVIIAGGATADEIRAHVGASGFRSMRFQALRYYLAGVTTAREVLRVVRS
ncbi:MAG: type II/IV secretion system protein [Kofleriaceae bacterium]|nr:type II/IV secretion system protein [Kofleriaceae bacterium]MBP6835998.1 type II/IV secretion system protein [Kofleriaceae bacterium]MBP9203525.1 type II/IV secretion system protein [Kofleriaceae bacterium]